MALGLGLGFGFWVGVEVGAEVRAGAGAGGLGLGLEWCGDAHRDAVQQHALAGGRHVAVLAPHGGVVGARVCGRPAPRGEHTLADGVDLQDLNEG